MLLSTKDYEQFKFRNDNRLGIKQYLVDQLAEEIQKTNLLHLHPILVNGEMEIIDGQHRFLAAKKLGFAVYYIIDEKLSPHDMLHMQIKKSWSAWDFLNFHCEHGNQNYIKFREFVRSQNLTVSAAFRLCFADNHDNQKNFRDGKMIFDAYDGLECLQLVRDTVELIRQQRGYASFLMSAKLWKALTFLFKNCEINREKWIKNIEMHAFKFGPRTSVKDYLESIQTIYNYRNTSPVRAVHMFQELERHNKNEAQKRRPAVGVNV